MDEEWLHELFSPHGRVAVRRLFGGLSVHLDGLVVALVIRDVLYLKADAETSAAFDAENLPPFGYDSRTGRRTITSYRQAPEAVLDDPDALAPWVRLTRAAAERAALAKSLAKSLTKPAARPRRARRAKAP